MPDVSAPTPVFSRGSTVLDYWLVHAEGLTVQPLGARVEEVVVTAPAGRAESLIVRSRVTHRRKSIPAESIAAVEPSAGELLLDSTAAGSGLRLPRPSPERVAATRASVQRGGRATRAQASSAGRAAGAGTVAALVWLRPRVIRAGRATARYSRVAAARTAEGVAWLAPRVAEGAQATATAAARLTPTTAAILAAATDGTRAGTGAAAAAKRGQASLEARRARR
jgi:hypothetical protein